MSSATPGPVLPPPPPPSTPPDDDDDDEEGGSEVCGCGWSVEAA